MSEIEAPEGWKLENDALKRVFVFEDFPHAIGFVVELGRLAEQLYHHPDVDIRWNKVHVTLCTHDAGGVATRKDVEQAEQANAITAEAIAARAKELFG
ncbi:MAG: 4a-hydroxytetrahydrobiopterin dehydratase [Verrucomicrobiota bacterium]